MAVKQKMRLNWQVVGRWTQTFGGSYFFSFILVHFPWECCTCKVDMLHSSNPSWARPYLIVGFSFSNPFFTPFTSRLALLPCHSITPAILLIDLCLLGLFWACCMFSLCLIPMTLYYHWASIHAILGFLGPFHRFRVSSTHFIPMGFG